MYELSLILVSEGCGPLLHILKNQQAHHHVTDPFPVAYESKEIQGQEIGLEEYSQHAVKMCLKSQKMSLMPMEYLVLILDLLEDEDEET